MSDSPWFWVLVFAAMALLGVTFIAPKHARRQERLVEKNLARDEVQLRQLIGTAAAPETAVDLSEETDPRAWYWPLMALLMALMLVASAALVLSDPRVKQRLAAKHENGSSSSSTQNH